MSSEAITRNDLTAILNEILPPQPDTPSFLHITSDKWSFESGYGSGTISGTGVYVTIFDHGQMVAFGGQLTASSFVVGGSGTPRMRTAKPAGLPANKVWSPVGVHRSGTVSGTTLSSSAWAFRDRIWAETDDNYLYLRSANFLGGASAGWLEFQLYGAVYPLAME